MDARAILFVIFGFLQIQGSPGREIPGWEIGTDRRTSSYIDPFSDTTIIAGREICQDRKTKIVIVVNSRPNDFIYRAAIRRAWAIHSGAFVKVGFIMGVMKSIFTQYLIDSSLQKESLMFRDIIQDSFVDSYYNLTIKAISLLKWFTRTCPNAQFLVKADQDTYVDVPRLIQRLSRYQNFTGVLRGNLHAAYSPVGENETESKYYNPEYMYPGQRYPDFLQGSAYYMTRDVAEKLFKTAMKTPIFHLEDVYITGICAEIAGVKPEKDYGVHYFKNLSVQHCVSECTVTCNSVRPIKMRWLMDKLKITHFNNAETYRIGNDSRTDCVTEGYGQARSASPAPSKENTLFMPAYMILMLLSFSFVDVE